MRKYEEEEEEHAKLWQQVEQESMEESTMCLLKDKVQCA